MRIDRVMIVLGIWLALTLPTLTMAGTPVRVVASFSILSDMVHQVGSDAVTVKSLVGPNGDAHVYEPTPSDAQELLAADLFVINGLGFEGWIERLVKASGFKGAVVDASKGIISLPMRGEEQGGHADPHAWHDLANARIYVANISEVLTRLAPEEATVIRANAARYDGQLADLDRWARSQFDTIPAARRKVITNHDAFGYCAHAYDVTFLAPVGVSTDAQPSAQAVAKLIMQAKQEEIQAIFIENMSDARLVRQLARETGIILGGTLYPDALSAPDGPASTYLELIRHNVTLLTQAMTRAC